MSWYGEDDRYGGLDDPFVPRDPYTGDPRPAGVDRPRPARRPRPPRAPRARRSWVRRLFGSTGSAGAATGATGLKRTAGVNSRCWPASDRLRLVTLR